MAHQSKNYENKKFSIQELSNALKKTFGLFKIDPDEVSIHCEFVINGIHDDKEMTFDEFDWITQFEDGFKFRLSVYGDKLTSISLSKMYGAKANVLYGKKNILEVSLSADKNELKKIFQSLEMELELIQILEDNNESETSNELIINSNNDSVSQISEDTSMFEIPNEENINKFKKPTIEYIKKEYDKEFGPVRLFKEDLIDIIILFKKSYKFIKITIDEYKIQDESSLDLVISKINKDSTNELYIGGSDRDYGNDIYLRLGKHSASITVIDQKDSKSRGVLDQVAIIISKRENKILKFIGNFKVLGLTTFVVILISILNFFNDYLGNITLILGFIPLIMVLISFYLTYNKHSLIYFFNSKEKNNFWKKNAETIMVSVLATIIGGSIVGIIVYYVTNRFLQ